MTVFSEKMKAHERRKKALKKVDFKVVLKNMIKKEEDNGTYNAQRNQD